MPENRKPKIRVQNLVLEITRACNMRCPHCLRGEPEDETMPDGVMDALFSRIRGIDTIMFTGGEPSMAPDIMLRALDFAKQYGIPVRNAWLATNGLDAKPEFLDACRQWHAYCLASEIGTGWYVSGDRIKRILEEYAVNDYERCGMWVAVSADPYHNDIPVDSLISLMTLPHLCLDKYQDSADGDNWCIPEGRAALNGLGWDRAARAWEYDDRARHLDLSEDSDGDLAVEELFVSATGLLLKHCDYSYESQESYALGKIVPGVDFPDAGGWLDGLAAQHLANDETEGGTA